jgi:prepilin-type N-terminal cleavage/methylation domain-containing protein
MSSYPERISASRAGFTLVELLVALVIAGTLAAVTFQYLLGQDRFVQVQSGREEVQQNARGAVELVSSELRGVPSAAVLDADEHTIRFRNPRAWGVICSMTTSQAIAAFPRIPGVNLSSLTNVGVAVATYELDGDGNELMRWRPGPGTAAAVDATVSATTSTACDEHAIGEADVVELGNLSFDGSLINQLLGEIDVEGVQPGRSAVFLFEEVTYGIGSSNVAGTWLRRRARTATAAGTFQAIAGPLVGDGLVLEYRDDAGNVLSTPVASPADIGQIDITVRMESRKAESTLKQQEEMQTTVYLRNRGGGS